MTIGGWIIMAFSVGAVSLLFSWCIFQVLTYEEDAPRRRSKTKRY